VVNHTRLPHLRPDELDPEQRSLYDRIVGGPRAGAGAVVPVADAAGRLEGPFNALLFHPRLGEAVQEVGRVLRFEGVLADRCREIVILAVAVARGSAYEWHAHARLSRAAGLSVAEIDALSSRQSHALPTEPERVAAELADALARDQAVDDDLYVRAERAIGTAGVLEVAVLAGYYRLFAQQLELFRVPAPPGPWER
jgi:4-carboxymuconolactone decarboxylase